MRIVLAAVITLGAACGQRAEEKPAPRGIDVVQSPAEGDLAKYVRDEQLRAKRDGRRVLVYVSASWCEPCRYFQEAVKLGDLDGEFPDLRLLKFDFDRDEQRLREAGYGGEMIPLWVVPEPSGRGSAKRMAGSVKGPEAVAEIRPRLDALLAD